MTSLPIETIRQALQCIPANLPRDEWARVAMALKSELDEPGFDLFNTWSQGGDSYSETSTRDTWRSVKAGGGVGIGSLMHLAKEHGFRWSGPIPGQEPRDAARRNTHADDESRALAHRDAAAEAARLWATASDTGNSPYLTRKAVKAYGVRHGSGGWLLVPLHDGQGNLWNLQCIAADKAGDRSDKRFLKGGRKSGLWHWCGDAENAPVLLIAEGYATAATLHEATGRPVAVAFDAGNLAHVAQSLRSAHPAASIMLCADDDRDTEAKTGRNPGRAKAQAAAEIVGGVVALPTGMPAGGSDFNDLAAHAGLDAVRQCIEAAQINPVRTEVPLRRGYVHTNLDVQEASDAPAPTYVRNTAAADRFAVDAAGVWYNEPDNEGRARAPLWVCSRLEVTARTRGSDGQDWGCLLEFADPTGRPRQWAMPMRMLAGDGTEFRAMLMDMGLSIAGAPKARNLLAQYVQTRLPAEFACSTNRLGWHGTSFVLPRETLGEGGERIVYQAEGSVENGFRKKGNLTQWQEQVARLCVGNSRLAFAVSCSFAGPLLRPANIDSGGFHLRGDSSCGKTTALRVAASVYGGAGYVQRWRATDNALEAIAAQHSDGLLILDELAQVDPKTAGECAYMLANEQSKARSTRSGQPRQRLTWRLLS